jgi:hypothetical protein
MTDKQKVVKTTRGFVVRCGTGCVIPFAKSRIGKFSLKTLEIFGVLSKEDSKEGNKKA